MILICTTNINYMHKSKRLKMLNDRKSMLIYRKNSA